MFSVMLNIYKREGISGLYRGFGATMLNTFSMRTFLMNSVLSLLTQLCRIRVFLFLLPGPENLYQALDAKTVAWLQTTTPFDCSRAFVRGSGWRTRADIYDPSIRDRHKAASRPPQPCR